MAEGELLKGNCLSTDWLCKDCSFFQQQGTERKMLSRGVRVIKRSARDIGGYVCYYRNHIVTITRPGASDKSKLQMSTQHFQL